MTHHMSLIMLCVIGGLSGCEWAPGADPVAQLGGARPQAITYLSDDVLAVSDVAYRAGQWGEGRVIFINPHTGSRYGAWFTPSANPQRLRVMRDHLGVVSSGVIDLTSEPRGGWSALSLLDLDRPLQSHQTLAWHATPRGTFLVDVALAPIPAERRANTPDHINTEDPLLRYHLSSGLDGVLWRADLSEVEPSELWETSSTSSLTLDAVRYAPSELLSLGALARWGSLTLVIDFNSDRLWIFDEQDQPLPCAPELGQFEGVMEGAQTPHVKDDLLWVSFGLSGRLIEIDLSKIDLEDEECSILTDVYDPPLGQIPNDLWVAGDLIYVLHSAENALWVYDRTTQQRAHVWPLPDQTNPWHLALSPDQSTLAISEWARGGVTLMSAQDGSLSGQISPEALAPPPPTECLWSDQQRATSSEASPRGWVVRSGGVTWTWDPDKRGDYKTDAESRRQHARPQDLQNVAQLAIAFGAKPTAVRLEVKLTRDDDWRPLIHSQFIGGQLDAPAEVGDALKTSIKVNSSLITTTSAPSSPTSDQFSLFTEPCELFSHAQYQGTPQSVSVARLTLTPAVDPERDAAIINADGEDQLWGGALPHAGHVPLYSVRMTPVDPEDEIKVLAVSYRSW